MARAVAALDGLLEQFESQREVPPLLLWLLLMMVVVVVAMDMMVVMMLMAVVVMTMMMVVVVVMMMVVMIVISPNLAPSARVHVARLHASTWHDCTHPRGRYA